MADLTVTAAQVDPVFPNDAIIRDYIAVEAITKGQPVYFTTAGKVGIADANAAGKQQFRGLALKTVGAGQPVSVLHEGEVGGYGVSGLNADALVYLSDTAGALADAAGTMTVVAGRVKVITDGGTPTKVLYVKTQWEANWA